MTVAAEQPPFPYATVAELRALCAPTGSLDATPDSVLAYEISGSASEVNAALITHHTLPLSYVPAAIKNAVITMASYRLRLTRGKHAGGSAPSDEVLKERYYDLTGEKGFLARLADGLVVFEKAIDATSNTVGFPIVASSGTPQAFINSDSSGNYVF